MAPTNIQSQEHRLLLDCIDKVRSQGLGRYVDIPEIIVCGDQSSGKSSVLEAISGLSFPTKGTLCTRFATELVLRRQPHCEVKVSIVPHHTRSAKEKADLAAFTATVDPDHPDLGPVIEAAKDAMGLSSEDCTKVFSNDVLRIELAGPKQQHLTLVDLPGLFASGNSEQKYDDAPFVRNLVREYIERPRSVIVAVVSAAYNFAVQGITREAREVDPDGRRTLGLITKPDIPVPGSDDEAAFVRLAQNKDVVLKLGWHVLRNRDFKMRDASSAERDAFEAKFFAQSAWTAVNPENLGIDALRTRLSTVLQDQIIAQLPSLLRDIERILEQCTKDLAHLGPARDTALAQRQYLSRISHEFSGLVEAAVDGIYTTNPVFFGGFVTGEPSGEKSHDAAYGNRLRAVVQNQLLSFAKRIREEGCSQILVDDKSKVEGERTIERSAYVEKVKYMLSRWRGRELPGTYNPLIAGELFRQQCQPWKRLAQDCLDDIFKAVILMLRAALAFTAAPDTADKILQHQIGPAIDGLRQDVATALQTLLAAHYERHPITYDSGLAGLIKDARSQRLNNRLMAKLRELSVGEVDLVEIGRALTEAVEVDLDGEASLEAVDLMEAYYKVALETFIDNVGDLVVEGHLLNPLRRIFIPDALFALGDAEMVRLAGESPAISVQRARLSEKKAVLESSLKDLRSMDKHCSWLDSIADNAADTVAQNSSWDRYVTSLRQLYKETPDDVAPPSETVSESGEKEENGVEGIAPPSETVPESGEKEEIDVEGRGKAECEGEGKGEASVTAKVRTKKFKRVKTRPSQNEGEGEVERGGWGLGEGATASSKGS